MWKIVQNTGSQLNTGQTPVATNQIDNLDRVKLSANDSLCYVVMVSNYNGSAPSTDFNTRLSVSDPQKDQRFKFGAVILRQIKKLLLAGHQTT